MPTFDHVSSYSVQCIGTLDRSLILNWRVLNSLFFFFFAKKESISYLSPSFKYKGRESGFITIKKSEILKTSKLGQGICYASLLIQPKKQELKFRIDKNLKIPIKKYGQIFLDFDFF